MKSFLLFVLAVALALFATLFAQNWLEQQKTATLREAEMVVQTMPTVVAATEIPFGITIQESHLKVVPMPKERVPANAFTEPAQVKGKIARQTIYSEEILRGERVADRAEGGGGALAALVSPNMRAVSVRVNDVIGVAGFLLPGDRVDVLASRPVGGNNREMLTTTVLERVKVLAVDQSASTEKDAPVIVRAVTLEVNPEQAELLVNATQEGSVQLALRNPLDEAKLPPPPKVAEAPPPQPAAPPPPQVIEKVVERVVYRSPPTRTVTVIGGTGAGVAEHSYQVSQ
jgi:pilus assembly protein CpaB